MGDRKLFIPSVNPDNVMNGFSHACPFAHGQTFKWKCQILMENVGKTKERWDFVRCPQDINGEVVGHGNGDKVRIIPAPIECPFREGLVIVYDKRFAGCFPVKQPNGEEPCEQK